MNNFSKISLHIDPFTVICQTMIGFCNSGIHWKAYYCNFLCARIAEGATLAVLNDEIHSPSGLWVQMFLPFLLREMYKFNTL